MRALSELTPPCLSKQVRGGGASMTGAGAVWYRRGLVLVMFALIAAATMSFLTAGRLQVSCTKTPQEYFKLNCSVRASL